MVGQQIKMVADNQPGLFQPRRLFSKLRQLDQQAVAQIFAATPTGSKTLDSLEDRFHLLRADLVIADAVDNIFNLNREVPVSSTASTIEVAIARSVSVKGVSSTCHIR